MYDIGVAQFAEQQGPVEELRRVTAVRKVLLDKFSDAAIRTGEPMFMLSERLVPVYLHHRYALDAAVKTVGGMEYTFAVRGDRQTPTRIIPAEEQRAALRELAAALQPSALAIPTRIVELIPPAPYGYSNDAWSFTSPAGVVFDPPRAGAKAQSEMLAKTRVKRIVAVSCNPATFARDARTLVDGGYDLAAVTIVDQFIWSAHVELVAEFRRRTA